MNTFKAQIHIIGVNPFVFVPEEVLLRVFIAAGKEKGHIPIFGLINGLPYKQTLVKYKGDWRLYVNVTMLKKSPKRIGEIVEISVDYDPVSRAYEMLPEFEKLLNRNQTAERVFNSLTNSRQQEIIRYLARLKTEDALIRNCTRAINFLLGKERFIGRNNP